MSDFFGKLKSGAGKVAFEADKLARLNRAQGELGQVKKQIEAQFLKLGELYYQNYTNPGQESPAYEEICLAISELERQASIKNEEVRRINAETYSPQGTVPAPAAPAPVYTPTEPAPAEPSAQPAPMLETFPQATPPVAAAQTKCCPNCGKEMALTAKFCPDCGTKME